MKIVFVSNYFNHHQKPFCEEMYKILGGNFTFISTTVMREERKKLGYSVDDNPDYVLLSYEDDEKNATAISLINSADVVIAGAVPNDMLLDRIRSGKLIFRYQERPFKINDSFLRKAYSAIALRKKDLFKKNVYLLCASAYTASDFASIGMYKNRAYKWGYFPNVVEYDIDTLLTKKKPTSILWCGRFIECKHLEDALALALQLKRNGYDFNLNIIGTGDFEPQFRQTVEDNALGENVHFLGTMSPENVRKFMEESGIFIFTSDRREGWGAVLNESLNSGCAVVACNAAGSAPFLIDDGENGALYEYGNVNMLYEKVKYFLDNPNEQIRIGRKAYKNMTDTWNAKLAAHRLLKLSERLLDGEKYPEPFVNGPCSKA